MWRGIRAGWRLGHKDMIGLSWEVYRNTMGPPLSPGIKSSLLPKFGGGGLGGASGQTSNLVGLEALINSWTSLSKSSIRILWLGYEFIPSILSMGLFSGSVTLTGV